MSTDVRQTRTYALLRDHSYRRLSTDPDEFPQRFGCWGCDWQGSSSGIAVHQAEVILADQEAEWRRLREAAYRTGREACVGLGGDPRTTMPAIDAALDVVSLAARRPTISPEPTDAGA